MDKPQPYRGRLGKLSGQRTAVSIQTADISGCCRRNHFPQQGRQFVEPEISPISQRVCSLVVMKVIVNDANILIDLVDLKILPYFFQLEFEFHTTAIILDELFDEQQEDLFPYIETGQLSVDNITEEDLVEVVMIRATKPNLSEQDCSGLEKTVYTHPGKTAIS